MDAEEVALITAAVESSTSQERLHILVVENDEANRLAVRRSLRRSDVVAAVDEAASAGEALECVDSAVYDCVLLDYHISGTDGLALLRAIRDSAPETPVVMVTTRGDEKVAAELMKAGAADYLPRTSLTPPRVASTLRHVLALARMAAERRRAKDELRAQRERIRRALQIETVGIVFSTMDGQIADANDAFLRMTGCSRDDLAAGRVRWDELTAPEGIPRAFETIEELRTTGRVTPYEREYVRGDGTRWWGLYAATRLADNRSVGFVLDITARKRTEMERERLLEREQVAHAAAERATERIAALQSVTVALAQAGSPADVGAVVTGQAITALGAAAGAMFLVDANADALEVAHIVGYTDEVREAFRRVPLSARGPLTDAIRAEESAFYGTREALLGAYPDLAAYVAAESHISHAIMPMILDRRALGALRLSFAEPRAFASQDQAFMVALAQQCAQALERARLFAAEQAARAEAEAAVQARDNFVTIISHDLRNPMTAIQSQMDLLRRRATQGVAPTAKRLVTWLLMVGKSVKRLSAQIDELHDATRMQAGRALDLQRHPTDLVALAREAATQYRHLSEAHRIRIETAVPSLIGIWDASRLERVLVNLLSNAIKYSPAGGLISVKVTHDGDWGILSVKDRGIGVPAQDTERIFQRYERASNVTNAIPGAGLGLAGARDIIALHGGSIAVQSEEGVGTTFVVRLPMTIE
ncbi:MAG TPA: ATP-binding protein [Ktedonobacterales bacterium]|nr:ATP-binding protein [Ktedonobacterales bacterium]